MEVGLKGGRQGDAELLGNERAKGADIAGAGDLHQVRAKGADQRNEIAIVPQEQQVVVMSRFQSEAHRTAPELHASG
jgi:hypothetical protein